MQQNNNELLDYDLAKEFQQYVFIHKSAIVEAALIKYYRDLQDTGIKLPDFMDESPTQKAQKALIEILNDKSKFNRMYNAVWEEVKWIMP